MAQSLTSAPGNAVHRRTGTSCWALPLLSGVLFLLVVGRDVKLAAAA